MQGLLANLESSTIGEVVRITPKLYPILMSLHVLGIVLLVGAALMMDLRLLGIARGAVSVTVAARYLLPVSRTGFVVVLLTGVPMFTAAAQTVGTSAAAPWKLGLILGALINVAVFHMGVYRSVVKWDLHAVPPATARLAAVVSAVAWVSTIFAGRFLAY